MRATAIQTLLAFGTLASAAHVLKRQGDAFDPDENLQPAQDCTDFGPTYVECVARAPGVDPLCIDPAAGETCCDNQWGCPADSFCLVQDLCCPDGLDPESCAAENNVDLPDDFGQSKPATDEPTPAPTESGSPTEPTDTPEEPSAEPTAPGTEEPPVQAGASGNKAGILGAVVGLAALAL